MKTKETLPKFTLFAYVTFFFVAIVVQLVMMYGYGYTFETDSVRIGSFSNLLAYGTAFLILYLLYYKYLKERFLSAVTNWRETALYVIGGFFALFLLGSIITFIYTQLGFTDTPENQETLSAYANALLFDKVSLVVFAVLFAPFVEEMVFRLGLMSFISTIFKHSNLNPKTVAAIGIVISSLLFGLVHVTGDIEQIFNYAGLGIILGYIYYKTDNVYTSVLCHMIYNGVAAIAMLAL